MLQLYTIFHLNLLYSSIEEKERPKVIENCYWPLLQLSDALNVPLGIELSGYTLEEIDRLDSAWIKKFQQLLQAKKIELVGSGYIQMIGPLVPAKVNEWNQKLGMLVYQNKLHTRPQIALLNEMTYSAGIVEHYVRSGYQGMVMEWNNPSHFHPEWEREWKYFPQRCVGNRGGGLPVIWADTISFQKFQRYAQSEMKLDEYLRYLFLQRETAKGYFSLYANDAEVFDFRPQRFKTESKIKTSEWARINQLFQTLKEEPSFKLIPPSEVLKGLNKKGGGNKIKLESAEQPIPVKKQEKYNINRWALTGRDDLAINTRCFQIFESLKKKKATASEWKKLCYFWASDFRTHITLKRWKKYQRELWQ